MGNSVAKGSIELSLDASKLNSQMAKQAKKSKDDAKKLGETFRNTATEKVGETFGGGSIIGLGAKAGIAGLAIGAAAFAGNELAKVAIKATEVQLAMERADMLGAKWLEGVSERLAKVSTQLAEFDSIAATATGREALAEQLKKLTTEYRGMETGLRGARDEYEKFVDKWSSPDAMQMWMTGSLDTYTAQLKKRLDDQQSAYDQTGKKITELKKKQNELTDPENSVAARTALQQFVEAQQDAVRAMDQNGADAGAIEKLKDRWGFKGEQLEAAKLAVKVKQFATISKETSEYIKSLRDETEGLTGDELKLQELKKKGASDAHLGAAQLAVQAKHAAATAKEAQEWINSLTNEAFGRSADDVKLAELQFKGADEKQMARLRQLIDMRKQLSDTYKPLTALERGTAAEQSFQNRDQFDQKKQADIKGQMDLMRQQLMVLNKIALGIAGIAVDAPEI